MDILEIKFMFRLILKLVSDHITPSFWPQMLFNLNGAKYFVLKKKKETYEFDGMWFDAHTDRPALHVFVLPSKPPFCMTPFPAF